MQKEINFYQEMASEHRLQEYSKGPVPLLFSNSSSIHYNFYQAYSYEKFFLKLKVPKGKNA